NDEHSAVSTVFLFPLNIDSAITPESPYLSAPACEDAEPGKQFCAMYNPYSEGLYELWAFLVDQAGNVGLGTGINNDPGTILIVDDTAPTVSVNSLPASPFRPTRIGDAKWAIGFAGTATDPAITTDVSSVLGSGVKQISIAVYDANGTLLGTQGEQNATVVGANWTLDYEVEADRITGNFTAWLTAVDAVGNEVMMSLPAFSLDTIETEASVTPPSGAATFLEGRQLSSSEANYLDSNTTLSGNASERPLTAETQSSVAGIDTVEVILEPMLAFGSPFVNTPLTLAYQLMLPFDEVDKIANDPNNSFTDLAQGLLATCSGASCPTAGVATRNGRGLHFDGVDDGLVLSNNTNVNAPSG
ncbi:MAG: hypothetical protein KAG66_17850, partial [Methylococcales bacterium]|nr:hypothetical protein [Methylococcales bacterium]